MAEEIVTHGMRIPFGKHKGERVTRLPVDYLEWLINEGAAFSPIAIAELKRRGVPLGQKKVDISIHAVDRASVRVLGAYLSTRKHSEGIHSWLVRYALEALAKVQMAEQADSFRVDLPEMKLVFTKGKLYPTLVTVMRPGYDKQD